MELMETFLVYNPDSTSTYNSIHNQAKHRSHLWSHGAPHILQKTQGFLFCLPTRAHWTQPIGHRSAYKGLRNQRIADPKQASASRSQPKLQSDLGRFAPTKWSTNPCKTKQHWPFSAVSVKLARIESIFSTPSVLQSEGDTV